MKSVISGCITVPPVGSAGDTVPEELVCLTVNAQSRSSFRDGEYMLPFGTPLPGMSNFQLVEHCAVD